MQIDVHSEIGRLRAVLVHKPGPEVVRMTRPDLDRMLFDDLLSPKDAAREHALVSDVMTAAGAKVLELTDVLVSALEAASADEVGELVETCCALARVPGAAASLRSWPPDRLAHALIEGVYWREIQEPVASLTHAAALLRSPEPMALRPLPNIMFVRDPCISVYDRVVQGRMTAPARARESVVVAFAVRNAPEVGANVSFRANDALAEAFHGLEGGDILVLSDEVMMIGCSERTLPATIERLAHEALFPAHPALERVYAVVMPTTRSVTHLDTILTQVDRQLFLGHAPLVAGTPRKPGLPVVRIDRGGPATLMAKAAPLHVLRAEFGMQTQLVPCGGDDALDQEREQWTDGAHAIALGPRAIMLYARNRKTIAALEGRGLQEVHLPLEEAVDARRQRVAEAIADHPTVFTFTGSELSRARGGARGLALPLQRESL